MRTFLNLPLLDINLIYQMFAHHCSVLPYPFNTMCSYSEQGEDTVQVLETILCYNPLFQTYVFYEVFVHVH